MRNLLIVTPHFPPVCAPDMHRVRTSLPHYRDFGWNPIVLSVAPEMTQRVRDPLLLKGIPEDVRAIRVSAIPARLARLVGVGNVGIRSAWHLHRAGARILKESAIDLALFSTTMFAVFPIARLWSMRARLPYVLDFQDPWYDGYSRCESPRTFKPRLAMGAHRVLERWTVPSADGMIAVSEDYIRDLENRYPGVGDRPTATIPFGAQLEDFRILEDHPQANPFLSRDDGFITGVSVGAVAPAMIPALRALFSAFQKQLRTGPRLFKRVRLVFIGTSYERDARKGKLVEDLAREYGLSAHVREHPSRVPHYTALQIMKDADFLLACGSDDPRYTASRIFPYIAAARPLLTLFHPRSSVTEVMDVTGAGIAVALDPMDVPSTAQRLAPRWKELLVGRGDAVRTDWETFNRYSAREMTRKQCELFDRVVESR